MVEDRDIATVKSVFNVGNVVKIRSSEEYKELCPNCMGIVRYVDKAGIIHIEIEFVEGKRTFLFNPEKENEIVPIRVLSNKDCTLSYERQKEGIEISLLNKNTGEVHKTRLDDNSTLISVNKELDNKKKKENKTDDKDINVTACEQEMKRYIKQAIYQDLIREHFTVPNGEMLLLDVNLNDFTHKIYDEYFGAKVQNFSVNLEKAQRLNSPKNKDVRTSRKAGTYKGTVTNCNRKNFVTEFNGLSVRHDFKDIARDTWKEIYDGRKVKIEYKKKKHILDHYGHASVWQLEKEKAAGRERKK